MKNILTLGLFFILTLPLFAQTDGISYQAVIIGPDKQELPGVDAQGNILPNATVAIRFTIIDANNTVEYQEVQTTNTDQYGRINLMIGAADHDAFTKISWDGTNKDLKVEIDFKGGSNYVDMSVEQLTFLPYAFHRNITATGTLIVDGDTFLNTELTVGGPTKLEDTLTVNNESPVSFSGDLTVDGATSLNSSLAVNNESNTNLSGALNVGESIVYPDGEHDTDAPTALNGTLKVIGDTSTRNFESTGKSKFNELKTNTLIVEQDITRLPLIEPSTTLNGLNTFNGGIVGVEGKEYGSNNLNGDNNLSGVNRLKGNTQIESQEQVKINVAITGAISDQNIDNYPLLIEGSDNGIAIKVNGSRSNANNFISFWDTSGAQPKLWGRIEGETINEFKNDNTWQFDQRLMGYDIKDAEVDLGFAIADQVLADAQLVMTLIDWRTCVGFGACFAAPGPADIAFALVEVISTAVQVGIADNILDRAEENLTIYTNNRNTEEGVTYQSGAGDYAEYLLRADTNEVITYGDIVGVKGGKISKNTSSSERMMVVSFKPIVLGNMPQPNREHEYEKVAFMGQVPVKVFGKVKTGDYIIPSGKNDGIGIAINPSQITSDHIENIVGIAWDSSNNINGFNMINVAVGLNKNDNNAIVKKLEKRMEAQDLEIAEIKNKIAESLKRLSKLEQSHAESSSNLTSNNNGAQPEAKYYDDRKFEIIETDKGEVIYWAITREDFDNALDIVEDQFRLEGKGVENNMILKTLKSDPDFKNKTFNDLKTRLDKQIHYHKETDKNGRH